MGEQSRLQYGTVLPEHVHAGENYHKLQGRQEQLVEFRSGYGGLHFAFA